MKSNKKNKESLLVPVGEMITSNQKSLNIEIFITMINSAIKRITSSFKDIADYFVIDWSFAEMNAIAKSNGLSLIKYLQLMFEANQQNNLDVVKDICKIASCSSHLTKNVAKDVRLYYPGKKFRKQRGVLIELIMEIMNCESFEEMDIYIKNLLVLLKKEHADDEYDKHFESLSNYFTASNNEDDKEHLDDEEETTSEEYKQLFKSSPFYQKFNNFYEKIVESSSGPVNIYNNTKFAESFLKKYLAYLPFFAGPFMKLNHFKTRANNGPAERFFGIEKKNNKDRHFGIQTEEKVGRYVKYRREKNQVLKARFELNLRTHNLASISNEIFEDSQDNWKNKNKTAYHSKVHISKNFISKN